MRLKRLLVMLLALAMCLSSFSVYAIDYPFWIDEIGPEKGSIQEISDEKLNADIEKVRQIAMKYADKYVVTQEDYVDTTVIDDFVYEMSTPLTLSEWDSGVHNDTAEGYTKVYDSQQYKDYMSLFKTLSGPCGLEVYFEPSCYFQVYRNIFVIGGYYDYSKCNLDVEAGFTNTVADIQYRTREIIQPDAQVVLKQKINDMFWSISQDTGLKVFVLECDLSEWEKYISDMDSGAENEFPTELSSAKLIGTYRFE